MSQFMQKALVILDQMTGTMMIGIPNQNMNLYHCSELNIKKTKQEHCLLLAVLLFLYLIEY